MKKLLILSSSLLVSAVLSIAFITLPSGKEPVVKSEIVSVIPQQTASTPIPVSVDTAPVVAPSDPVPAADPTIVPVRDSETIILDYPNLSGDAELLRCTRLILAEFPDRFTPEKREVNIKLLSTVFVNSRSALLPNPIDPHYEYLKDSGQGDFWQRFGGL